MDRALAVLARMAAGSFHLVADFDGEPDVDALEEAWRRLVDRHPVMRARTRLEDDSPMWDLRPSAEPLAVLDDPAPVDPAPTDLTSFGPASVIRPGEIELGVLRAEPSVEEGPLTRLTLLRRDDGTRLVCSTHHVLYDAASGIRLFDELGGHYRAVRAGVPATGDVDDRSRLAEDLLGSGRLAPLARAAAMSRMWARWASTQPSTHLDPAAAGDRAGYAAVDVSEVLPVLEMARSRRRWRTAAVLLALVSRGWERTVGTVESGARSGWQLSSDLRLELGINGGIGNLSSTEPVTLTDVVARPVDEIVTEAHRIVTGLSSSWPGLAVPLAISSVPAPWSVFAAASDAAVANVARLRLTRSFSNVGAIDPAVARWGDCEVRRLFYAPAMTAMPWVTVVTQGLGPSLWLSMRVHECGWDAGTVHRFGRAMVDDALALAAAIGG